MSADRDAVIAGLRQLADLLERVPELPAPPHGHLNWTIGGGDDGAIPAYERAVEALGEAGVDHTASDVNGHLGINLVLDGARIRIHHVCDSAMAEYGARASYVDNVQVDRPASAQGEDGGGAA